MTQISRKLQTLRGWHYGKLVILWAWGAIVSASGYILLKEDLHELLSLNGIVIILIIAAPPTLLSALTWLWLGGKEGNVEPTEQKMTKDPKDKK